jgi:hypothetical protein
LYPPSLAAIGSNGLNYKPYYFWRPRSLHGYPLSPFPADDVTGGLEGGVDDDEDNIRVSVRSSPDLAPISNAGGQRSDDSWFVFLKLSCDERFTHAFTAFGCVFKEITLVGLNQGNYFENATACSKRKLKTTVATQL